jgi:hypothetical protein
LAIGAGVVAVAVAIVYFTKQAAQMKRDNADRALATAQSAYYSGNIPLAKTNLEKAATSFVGTAGGAQAAMLLAQISFNDGKYDEGIKQLMDGRSSVPAEFAPDYESLIADGFADNHKLAEAADHYGKAADATPFAADKDSFRASQARALAAAGKSDDARKIWVQLATNPESPSFSEARVRLGELGAKAASK